MAYLGKLGLAVAGEVKSFASSFASALAPGDTLVSAACGCALAPDSPVADGNAANLVLGAGFVAGSSVAGFFGGLGPSTWIAGAKYQLFFKATTSFSETLIAYGDIYVDAVSPPSIGGSGPTPSNEFTLSAPTTITQPGLYWIAATGITQPLPSSPIYGDIVFADKTSAADPAFALSGTVLNRSSLTDLLPALGRITAHWSALYNGWVVW